MPVWQVAALVVGGSILLGAGVVAFLVSRIRFPQDEAGRW